MTEGAPATAITASRQARPSSAEPVDQFGAHGHADVHGRRSRPGASIFGQRAWLFLVLPGLFIAASALYPFAQLVRMSLSNVGAEDIIGHWPFVGTANFHSVVSSAGFWQSVKTSVAFTAAILVVDLLVGFVAALWLIQPMKGAGAVQSLMILAWALPPIVSGTAWKFLLQPNGFVNAVLGPFGLGNVEWLASSRMALWSLIGVVAWASIPFCAMVIKAGLLGIPRDTVEASRVDGAGDLQVVARIIVPQLRSLLAILAVLIVVYGFGGSFSFIYVVTEGGPGTSTTTLPYLGYADAFTDFDFGVGAAIAVISMVVVGLLAMGYLRASGREERMT
jgi:multiple sugar transport system permease protein